MTPLASKLIARHDARKSKLSGVWALKSDDSFVVKVEPDSDNGTMVLITYPDGMMRQRARDWFVKNYQRK